MGFSDGAKNSNKIGGMLKRKKTLEHFENGCNNPKGDVQLNNLQKDQNLNFFIGNCKIFKVGRSSSTGFSS